MTSPRLRGPALVAVAVAVALAPRRARADEVPPPTSAPAPPSPGFTEQVPTAASPVAPRRSLRRQLLAAGAVTATYAGLGTWLYYAWFRDAKHRMGPTQIVLSGFASDSYAGGADKLGHAWGNYTLSRLTTQLLIHGGFERLRSSLVASGMAATFFTLSEVQDSFIHEFEIGDEVANLSGAALAVLMTNVPALDRLFDFRLEYYPSHAYLAHLEGSGDVDGFQDYSGQSYMLALHVDALPHATWPRWAQWTRYADVVLGFETRNYEPVPQDPSTLRRQVLYLGITVNMQHVLGRLFCPGPGRAIGDGVFEVLSVPYTTLKFPSISRSPGPYPPPP